MSFLIASKSRGNFGERPGASKASILSLALLHVTTIQDVSIEFKVRVFSFSIKFLLLLTLNLLLSQLCGSVGARKILDMGSIHFVKSESFLALDVALVFLFIDILLAGLHTTQTCLWAW